MAQIIINNQTIEIDDNSTILQACQSHGVNIPFFCYHPRLEIAGNCRMCLVEVEGSNKLVASCHNKIKEGMVINTTSEKVKNARQGVLEFLLINHPLDCPICDQGGECDLQDIAFNYGFGKGRLHLPKRAVSNKYIGPLIKTVMNRCIHCTRCIRFGTQVAGVPELVAVNRGENTEITSYLEQAISSELSGNLIDVCPVGALTNKAYAFNARNWDLQKTDSIDVLDAVGSNINIHSYNNKVVRILPRVNENINEEWLDDRARFSCDGLQYQRLNQPYIRQNGKLVPIDWESAFNIAVSKIRNRTVAALAGPLTDCETMFCMKYLLDKLESPHYDCRYDGNILPIKYRGDYLFNTTISGIAKADAVLMIGTNPRFEAPILNAAILKNCYTKKTPIGLVGPKANLNYSHTFLGEELRVLKSIYEGANNFSKILAVAKNPMLIIGASVLNRSDSLCLFYLAQMIAEKYNMVHENWNGFNVLQNAASRVGGLDIGFVPQDKGFHTNLIAENCQSGGIQTVYLLGMEEKINFGNAFVIYQGHHFDTAASQADLILPSLAYTEKTATYVNTEGRVQTTQCAVQPQGIAKEDWKIVRMLAEKIGISMPFNNLLQVREGMANFNKIFAKYDEVTPTKWSFSYMRVPVTISQHLVDLLVKNYYQNDVISCCSPTMAKCASINKKYSN